VKSKSFYLSLVTCHVLLALSGCTQNNPEELDRLIKEDPAFNQMIVARDQTHAQIHLIKQDLMVRKKQMDSQVMKLRGDYEAYAKTENEKIKKYQSQIEARKNELEREIKTEQAQLAAKETEHDGYEKTYSDVSKVLRGNKGITLTAQEKLKWEERALMLSEKMRPLSEEIQNLRAEIRLKKRKVSFLK
jgi:hypothetical protein